MSVTSLSSDWGDVSSLHMKKPVLRVAKPLAQLPCLVENLLVEIASGREVTETEACTQFLRTISSLPGLPWARFREQGVGPISMNTVTSSQEPGALMILEEGH